MKVGGKEGKPREIGSGWAAHHHTTILNFVRTRDSTRDTAILSTQLRSLNNTTYKLKVKRGKNYIN